MIDNIIDFVQNNLIDIGWLLTGVIAAVTAVKSYQSTNLPQIDFSLEESPKSLKSGIRGDLFIRIKNNGKAPAYSVKIQSHRKLNDKELKLRHTSTYNEIVDPIINWSFDNPKEIRFLPSLSERKFFSLKEELVFEDPDNLPAFDFSVSWKAKRTILPFKRSFKQKYTIDYNDFKDSIISYEHEPIVSSINRNNSQMESMNRKLKTQNEILGKIKNQINNDNVNTDENIDQKHCLLQPFFDRFNQKKH